MFRFRAPQATRAHCTGLYKSNPKSTGKRSSGKLVPQVRVVATKLVAFTANKLATQISRLLFSLQSRKHHSDDNLNSCCFPSLMASMPFPCLCLFQKPNSLTVSFVASDRFKLNSYPTLRLGTTQRSRKFGITVCRAAPVAFRNLDADDFRHPLDQQNTVILRAIPGLNELGKALLGTVAEQIMLLENIGTSVLVSENQLPGLHQLMVEAAEVLNVDAPDLYVRQSPVPNAYTLAISGKRPFVVVHTSLVELLTREELQAVLAHELGHLKCDHGVWLTYANILTLGAYTVPGIGGLIARTLEEQLFRWLRAAELTCDRAALLVAQDPKIVISVLMKLAGGCPSMADQLNVDAFLEQARSYDKASSSPVGWYLRFVTTFTVLGLLTSSFGSLCVNSLPHLLIRNAQTSQLSHPLPVLRAREIDEWSKSPAYKSLLKRGTPIKSLQNV